MRRAPGLLAAVAVAVLYFAVVTALQLRHDVFAYESDEGITAIKALLLDRGHALYTDIWEDQPPLFSHLLRAWFAAGGWSVNGGRVLIVLFAAVALFALYDLLRLASGHAAAALACALLVGSAYFVRLSVSLMIGLPAVALTLVALWALYRYLYGGGTGWLAAAGLAMAAALACKLFIAFLLPVFAVWLALAAPRAPGASWRWRPAVGWLLGTVLAAAAALLVLVGPGQLAMLAGSHLAGRDAALLSRFGPLGLLLTAWAEWPLTILGLGACALLVRQRRWTLLVFPLWAALALVVLLLHRPFWYHYQLLLSVPYSAAAGVVVAELFRRDAAALPARRLLRTAAAALVAAQLLWSVTGGHRRPAPTPLAGAPADIVAALNAAAPAERRMLSSDPMYAFRAGYDVPPWLANLCLKRVATDARLAGDLAAEFGRRPPPLVLLTAGAPADLADWIRAAMGDRYELMTTAGGVQLFALRARIAD